jgi:hypothetical protein
MHHFTAQLKRMVSNSTDDSSEFTPEASIISQLIGDGDDDGDYDF